MYYLKEVRYICTALGHVEIIAKIPIGIYWRFFRT